MTFAAPPDAAPNGGAARTILRVKRRLTEDPLPYIRLEGVRKFNSDASLPRAAVWKRRLEDVEQDDHGHCSYRVVNAKIDGDSGGPSSTKRRKLTLLPADSDGANNAASPTKRVSYPVLDPLARMVDDSLASCLAGDKPIPEHVQWILTDLARNSKKWLAWAGVGGGGNILHACALWNDVEMASTVLQSVSSKQWLMDAMDGDRRTPYDVAQLSGHDSVGQVLEAFGGDTANYVYDTFFLQSGDNVDDDIHGQDDDMEDAKHQVVELHGGVGYWTTLGDLVLEHQDPLTKLSDDDDEVNEDDIDSNCQEYGGNDYPDEDEYYEDYYDDYENDLDRLPRDREVVEWDDESDIFQDVYD